MGRKAWMGILLALAVTALLVAAWLDAGREPLRWIEEPIAPPREP